MAVSGQQHIVIGVFDDPASADRSLMALQEAGFSNEQIRHTTGEGAEQSSHKGIKALFSGEKMAPHKDVTRDLVNMGVDPQDARIYQHEYEEGHPLVSVMGKGDMQKAITILQEQGAYAPEGVTTQKTNYQATGRAADVSGSRPAGEVGGAGATRASERAAGMPGSRAAETGTTDEAAARERAAGMSGSRTDEALSAETPESRKIRLRAERLKAYTQPEQVGEVDVHKEVVTEQQTLNVPVTREEVVVERRSLAEDASAAEGPIGEDETIRIPVREERVNVTKEAVATGEVEISKRQVKENRQFSDTVRREEARLENQGDVPIIDTESNQPPPSQPQI
jgi:uncharacterized protein (TIGR02271 family)